MVGYVDFSGGLGLGGFCLFYTLVVLLFLVSLLRERFFWFSDFSFLILIPPLLFLWLSVFPIFVMM